MGKKSVGRKLPGTSSANERDYEIRHRQTAREAAASGMVLLKNEENLLPLSTEKPVALYGAGAVMTIKGGTGSGDVNSRHTVSIREGMKNAGYHITTEKWLADYEDEYNRKRLAWRDFLWEKAAGADDDQGFGFFMTYSNNPFVIPTGPVPSEKSEDDTADTAIYVVSRTAGEGADRKNEPGDYLLTGTETDFVCTLCGLYENVVLVLNTDGLIDLGFTDSPKAANIKSILYIHQPGMEAGNAFADIISGAVTPSGKLTDTWAYSYNDWPNAETYSSYSGDVTREDYVEGIYVGYRYFDTFNIPVRYPFGYGLSYTSFEIKQLSMEYTGTEGGRPEIVISFGVTNTGSRMGKEVVEVYASCHQRVLEKEFRRLIGFKKTRCLYPGEYQEIEITFPLYVLASYDETLPGWVMEKGQYFIMAGNSLENTFAAGNIETPHDLIFSKTQNICPLKSTLKELTQDEVTKASVEERRLALAKEGESALRPILILEKSDIITEEFTYDGAYENTPAGVREFVDALTTDQLINLACGDFSKESFGSSEEDGEAGENQLGSAGTAVPGSAAQTSDCARDAGLPEIVLADGPAGLRLLKTYQAENGKPLPYENQADSLLGALEGGFLMKDSGKPKKGETMYQYCTAFPVGTALAQSWDINMIKAVGAAAGEELLEFGVTLWLAPGMNIHRNPLCGRNFEYYAEDPVLAGFCAAAMTQGVQSVNGVGTTIKHFACNNQEDNRMGSDSVLSERTLREIYLRGFEIAVEKSRPMSIMTSYNLINGVHSANNYDLCTKAARCEWGFKGVIMTDWTTTMQDETCTAAGCMRAGNDLVMPGAPSDHENIRKELEAGTLKIEDLKRSVSRLVNTVWQSAYVEDNG